MYAYVVKGSEDGNLGVFRSKKRAIEAAKEYVTNAATLAGDDFAITEFASCGQIVVAADWSWVSCDIEQFTYS